LKTLGDDPIYFSIIGNDMYKELIVKELEINDIETNYVLPLLEQTVQPGILFDGNNRKILLDLKNIQEITYPEEKIDGIINQIDIELYAI
jgi:sugar/nucleoside kinase (ribokinase family)